MNLFFATLQTNLPEDKMHSRLLKLQRFFAQVNSFISDYGFEFSLMLTIFYLPRRRRLIEDRQQLQQNLAVEEHKNLSGTFIDFGSSGNLGKSFLTKKDCRVDTRFGPSMLGPSRGPEQRLDGDSKFESLRVPLLDMVALKQVKMSRLLRQLLLMRNPLDKVLFSLQVKRVIRKDPISHILANHYYFIDKLEKRQNPHRKRPKKNEERDSASQNKNKKLLLEKWKTLKQFPKSMDESISQRAQSVFSDWKSRFDLFLWKHLVFHDNSNYFWIKQPIVFLLVVLYIVLIELFFEPIPDNAWLVIFSMLMFPFIDIFNVILYIVYFFTKKSKILRILIFSSFLTIIKGALMGCLTIFFTSYSRFLLFSLIQVIINIVITYIQCFNYSYLYFEKYVVRLKQIE